MRSVDIVGMNELDCRGLRCPMPIVRLGLTMRAMGPGERLGVQATDPAFEADLNAWARRTGHRVISFERGEVATAVIEKSDA